MAKSELHRPEARLHSLSVDGDSISARLSLGDLEHVLAFRAPGVPLAERYEPFLVAALPIAMSRAASLSVPEPVSPRLLDALPTVQRIYNAWEPSQRIVPVEAPRGAAKSSAGGRAASFFSGGVDGFFTALRNLDGIDAFVLVHGFDLPLEDLPKRRAVSEALRAATAELGRPLLEVETNLRSVSDRYWHWDWGHGVGLASIALLLGGGFRRVLIPASHSYRDLLAWGSHPLLDPLWSTETVELIHEGAASRVEKLAEIARSELALRHLRVCLQTDASWNCGRCPKCLRTMVGLQLVGGLERCPTLPHRIPLRALARIQVRSGTEKRSESGLSFTRENLDAAETMGSDPRLVRALRRMNRRGTWYLALKPRGPGAWDILWRAAWKARRVAHRARPATRRAEKAPLPPRREAGEPGPPTTASS